MLISEHLLGWWHDLSEMSQVENISGTAQQYISCLTVDTRSQIFSYVSFSYLLFTFVVVSDKNKQTKKQKMKRRKRTVYRWAKEVSFAISDDLLGGSWEKIEHCRLWDIHETYFVMYCVFQWILQWIALIYFVYLV